MKQEKIDLLRAIVSEAFEYACLEKLASEYMKKGTDAHVEVVKRAEKKRETLVNLVLNTVDTNRKNSLTLTDAGNFDMTDLKISKGGYEFTCSINGEEYSGDFGVYASEDECYIDSLNLCLEDGMKYIDDDALLIECVTDKLSDAIQDRHSEYLQDRREAAADAMYDSWKDSQHD